MVNTKQKKKNGTAAQHSAVALLTSPSMSTANHSARVRNVTTRRKFLEKNWRRYFSEQVLSGSQSPTATGSQFSAGTLLFDVGLLSDSAQQWIQSYDKYRIKEVEVNVYSAARLRNTNVPIESIPITVYAYEDQDADPLTTTSWIRVQDRENLCNFTMNAAYPRHHVVTFNPTPSMAADQQTQNPSNLIFSRDQWLDALSIDQKHAGLRFFACCPTTDTSGQSYDFELNFEVRYTVEVQQPL